MNTDQKTAAIHDAIKALGMVLVAVSPMLPQTWQTVVTAIPGLLLALWGVYLTFSFNSTPDSTTNSTP